VSFTSALLQLLQNARPTYAPESIGQTQCYGVYEYAYIYICDVGMFCWQVSEVAIKLGAKCHNGQTQMVWCQKAAGAQPRHALGNVLLLDLIFGCVSPHHVAAAPAHGLRTHGPRTAAASNVSTRIRKTYPTHPKKHGYPQKSSLDRLDLRYTSPRMH